MSSELETLYRIESSGDGLVARHVRSGEIGLTAVAEDEFQGSEWYFGSVRFERDAERRITGFRLSGGRVRSLLFRRVDGASLGLE